MMEKRLVNGVEIFVETITKEEEVIRTIDKLNKEIELCNKKIISYGQSTIDAQAKKEEFEAKKTQILSLV